MATNQTANIAIGTAFFGALAFILGVVAENKKPAQGTPFLMKDFVLCKFPHDPTVALGSLSVVAFAISATLGLLSVFFPYNGISVPKDAIFRGWTLRAFFVIAVLVSALAEAMMMWATGVEGRHRTLNKHEDMDYTCPTAKTGLFGGAAFLALDASLFWLICQMLALNARADHLEEQEDPKGSYGEVLAVDYDTNGAANRL